jgi:hypothetical protein
MQTGRVHCVSAVQHDGAMDGGCTLLIPTLYPLIRLFPFFKKYV